MAETTVAVGADKGGNLVERTRRFWNEVRAEFRKITWPDRLQLRQATGAIIVFVLLIGLLIYLMDVILQALLVRGIPSLFGA
jgi:preprotein translocase subunit SecE